MDISKMLSTSIYVFAEHIQSYHEHDFGQGPSTATQEMGQSRLQADLSIMCSSAFLVVLMEHTFGILKVSIGFAP